MTKKELRTRYLQKRLSLSESEVIDLSQRICTNFFAYIDLQRVRTLHTFLPIPQKREPDTWLIVDELNRKFPHIRISIPKINVAGTLENYDFKRIEDLESSAWGIPEPKNGELTHTTDIDMVIVPLLAYDKTGNRVGYGKGHYDRFLKMCRPDCRKIGISFFEPEERIEPDQFDVKLTGVITPGALVNF